MIWVEEEEDWWSKRTSEWRRPGQQTTSLWRKDKTAGGSSVETKEGERESSSDLELEREREGERERFEEAGSG